MNRLYEFIKEICNTYGIDASHDLSHAKDCVNIANLISPVEFHDHEMVVYAAALHDCVDKKYINPIEGVRNVEIFLTHEGWSTERIKVLIHIITTMSYSYLNSIMVDGRIVFPDHGKYRDVYHIVREADLLCSYRVRRCYLYQKHISPNMPEAEVWKNVVDLFETRMFKYLENGWLTLPKAISWALKLEEIARKDLESVKLIHKFGDEVFR
jgi:HD superfamily phosphodiesterase